MLTKWKVDAQSVWTVIGPRLADSQTGQSGRRIRGDTFDEMYSHGTPRKWYEPAGPG